MISRNLSFIFKMLLHRLKLWIVSWVYSALNYLHRVSSEEKVELQQVRIMSSQEKRARILLWNTNNSQSIAPKCDSPKDSAKKVHNKPDSYLSPANSVRNNLKRRHSCSNINQHSLKNPKSPEWLPYVETDLTLD